jgi:chromosome segregation ATPase
MATATAETGTVSQDDGASVNATIANEKSKTLPKSSREKIGKLKRAWSAYGYKSGALYEAQQDAHARRAELAVQIGHLKRTIENQRGIIGAADHKRLADLESQHTECLTEIAELVAESANLPSPFDPRVIAAFLANAGSRRLKASVPTVALRKGQTAIAALNEIRNEISDLVEAIDDIRTAPLPKNDSITNAVAEIERIAAKGAPYFGRCRITEPGANGRTRVGTVRWPLKFDDTGQESIDSGSMLIDRKGHRGTDGAGQRRGSESCRSEGTGF